MNDKTSIVGVSELRPKAKQLIKAMALTALVSCFAVNAKPNIVHILVDDVGYDDIGVFGSKDIKTPNLDKLAKNGVRFTNFYAPHPSCTPTRAALLTGRLAPRANNNKGIGILWPNAKNGLEPKQQVTVAKLLRDNGYQTGLFGKWHLGDHVNYLPTKHGFDQFYGIPFPNDHGPERYWNMGHIGLDQIPVLSGTHIERRVDNNQLAELPAEFTRRAAKFMRDSVEAKRPFYLQYSNIETHTPWFVPKGFNGYSAAGEYGDSVEYMDRSVGVLVRQLKQLKQLDNTLIIFSSDNGPLVHEYPELEAGYGKFADVDAERGANRHLHEGKYQARYEGGPRSAFIMSWPGQIPTDQVREHIVDGTDVFTTMLAAANVELPVNVVIDGHDILPIAQNDQHKGVRNVFYSFTGDGTLMGLRVGDWKLAVPHRKTWAISRLKQAMLFNLAQDPHEDKDLADKYPNKVKKMLQLAEQAKANIKNSKPMIEWAEL